MSKPATLSILIVDDDPDLLDMASAILQRRGYRVVTASSGAEALHLLQDDHLVPGVILLDLMMPVMSGWQFRSELLHDRELAKLPVIFFSGDIRIRELAAKSEIAGYEMKPISAERLVAIAKKYCGKAMDPAARTVL